MSFSDSLLEAKKARGGSVKYIETNKNDWKYDKSNGDREGPTYQGPPLAPRSSPMVSVAGWAV